MPVIEVNGPVNSVGLHDESKIGGSYTTPLREYPEQAYGYGNSADTVRGYVDMGDYLKDAPFLDEFLRAVKNYDSDEADTQLDTQPGDSVEVPFKKGGIDFNSSKMGLDIQNNGGEINFQIDAALLERLEAATGFTPVILNIQPLPAVRMFLGINTAPSPNA